MIFLIEARLLAVDLSSTGDVLDGWNSLCFQLMDLCVYTHFFFIMPSYPCKLDGNILMVVYLTRGKKKHVKLDIIITMSCYSNTHNTRIMKYFFENKYDTR